MPASGGRSPPRNAGRALAVGKRRRPSRRHDLRTRMTCGHGKRRTRPPLTIPPAFSPPGAWIPAAGCGESRAPAGI